METDLHVHTFFSPCALATMSFNAVLEAAERAGVREIGLTDHPHRAGLARHHRALHAARADYRGPVRVWIGAELEVAGMGRLVIPPATLPHADYLVAAPSHYDVVGNPPVLHPQDPFEWADRILTDMENVPGSGARTIAHPFFVHSLVVRPPPGMRLPNIDDVLAEIRPKRLERLLERLATEKIALEISPRLSLHLGLESFIEETYRMAQAMGVRFTTGSDAHKPDDVGQLREAEGLVRRLDLGPADFWHPGMT